jgi:hypothetical protein
VNSRSFQRDLIRAPYSSAGLSRLGSDVFNLYYLTRGNYRVHRPISYPEYPESQLEMYAHVKAVNDSEWIPDMTIIGTYKGPTNFVATKDYQIMWTADGETLLESGSTTHGRKR